MVVRRRDSLTMMLRPRCVCSGFAPGSAASVSAQPLMAVSGVRSSCETEDELLLDLLGLRDLERHIVDVVHQLAELVAVVVVDQDAVAAGGDAPCGVGHDGDRLGDVVDEDGVGEDGKAHAQQRNADGDRHADEHAAVPRAAR